MTADLRRPPLILLDDSRPGGGARLYTDPDDLIVARRAADVPAALAALDAAVQAGDWIAGFFAYELAGVLEPKLAHLLSGREPDAPPLIWCMRCRTSRTLAEADTASLLRDAAYGHDYPAQLDLSEPDDLEAWYTRQATAIHEYLMAGDVYQINLTFPFAAHLHGDPLALYRQWRRSQPVPFGAYIDTGTHRILSASPELFLARRGNRITVKPMKGTAPRGRWANEDEAHIAALTGDPKCRAENLMIVDLLRNDLSRIAADGSVTVKSLFDVERLPSVLQMTSTIDATVADDLAPSAVLQAVFPCGSVTGAPKIRAMEVINDLERGPRHVYCGAIGQFTPQGWALSVPIRTLMLDTSGRGSLSVGSGLVADSDIPSELAESRLKAQFARMPVRQTPPALIETMRVDPGGDIALLDRHMARLMQSADYFAVPLDLGAIHSQISAHIAHIKAQGLLKLRLLVGMDGRASITSTPATDSPHIRRLALARPRLDAQNPMLYHKTTDRALYDQLYAEAVAQGFDDVIFLNEAGCVCEGAIHTLYIRDGDIWKTPPISDGLLPGVARAALLADSARTVKEHSLTLDDLKSAPEIYVSNAVRGVHRAELVDCWLG